MSLKDQTMRAVIRFVGIVACAATMNWAGSSSADDVPVDPQDPGWHSTIVTADGSVRDDELADYVAQKINEHGGEVKDVKIIFNTCFGGGFLDDFQRVFGSGGAAEGVRWVGVSAANESERSWCYRDSWADTDDPVLGPKNLGSKYTSGLAGPQSGHGQTTPGSMHDDFSDNVLNDFDHATLYDEAGPHWEDAEHPVVGSGNGGDQVTWSSPGASHQVVMFGGNMDHPAYENDMDNMTDALLDVWGDNGGGIQYGRNGTRQDLFDAIDAACAALDGDTQLILYFTDHGDREFDFAEWWKFEFGKQPPWYPIEESWEAEFILDAGWPEAMAWMNEDPTGTPQPTLDMMLGGPIIGNEWSILLNGVEVPLPPGPIVGMQSLPVTWWSILAGPNVLRIKATTVPPSIPLFLERLQLSSGPVSMGRVLDSSIPAVSPMGLGVIALMLVGCGIVVLRKRRSAIAG